MNNTISKNIYKLVSLHQFFTSPPIIQVNNDELIKYMHVCSLIISLSHLANFSKRETRNNKKGKYDEDGFTHMHEYWNGSLFHSVVKLACKHIC